MSGRTYEKAKNGRRSQEPATPIATLNGSCYGAVACFTKVIENRGRNWA